MTDINDTPIESTPEALTLDDSFAADFFAPKATADKAPVEEPTPEESDSEITSHESDTEDEADEGNPEDTPDEGDEADEGEPEPVKGKKKSRFQERIDDLTAKLREQERLSNLQASQLAEAIAKLETAAKPAEKPNTQNTKTEGLVEPTADDTLEDGSPKYPLGEFDPKLLRDLTRYDRAVERAHDEQVAAERREEQKREAELNTLSENWNGKVTTAKEAYPDYVEKGQALLDSLGDVPQDYAVYLTTSLMGMDYGPDVFYYLAEHPEEARAIVNSSPDQALVRLGRIEARFEIAADEKSGKETKLRTSKAPEPAPRNKGSNAQAPVADLATIGLDDFAKDFLRK